MQQVTRALEQVDLAPLLVGGFVRDLLLGRESKDVDLIVSCSPRSLLRQQHRLSGLTGAAVVPLDSARGTVRLCFGDGAEFDLVSLQGDNLYQDLGRRDFTINAMAVDREARLADPFAGRDDLAAGLLRTVAPANLEDDPLRVLRCLRLVAHLGFQIEPATFEACRKAGPGLHRVAGERIVSELEKFFAVALGPHLDLMVSLDLRTSLAVPYGLEVSGLIAEVGGYQPLGLELGLALLFGPSLPSQYREKLFKRLRLSRTLRRYLVHFWDGADRLRRLENLTALEIYRLFRTSRQAFPDLARALSAESFPSHLTSSEKAWVHLEAQGQGGLRWTTLPWSGERIRELARRPDGPWLGQAKARLEQAWALGELEREDQILAFLPIQAD